MIFRTLYMKVYLVHEGLNRLGVWAILGVTPM